MAKTKLIHFISDLNRSGSKGNKLRSDFLNAPVKAMTDYGLSKAQRDALSSPDRHEVLEEILGELAPAHIMWWSPDQVRALALFPTQAQAGTALTVRVYGVGLDAFPNIQVEFRSAAKTVRPPKRAYIARLDNELRLNPVTFTKGNYEVWLGGVRGYPWKAQKLQIEVT